jgi:signal transduction histidine kinase
MRTAAEKATVPRVSPDAALEAGKRDFLRVVSHELRTPLNSILGFSEILASELYGPLGAPQYKEYAEIVRDSGHKLLRLVNQLVEMARLQSGAVDFEAHIQPLGPAVQAVLAELAPDMAEGAVTAVTEGVLPAVSADPRGLRSMLSGLLHNAVVFSPPDGEVRIHAAQRGKTVTLTVENPGEVIDPADALRLLRPFEQGETGLTRRQRGAGLGLSICALTAKAMGGRLRLAARPGGGLQARVSLPAA